MARLPLWHIDTVEIVKVDPTDLNQVKEWAQILFSHAPRWVVDAVLGQDNPQSRELTEHIRNLMKNTRRGEGLRPLRNFYGREER